MSRMIPRGHEVAGLGRRFLAYLVDVAPAAVIGGVAGWVLGTWATPVVVLVTSISAAVLILVYGLVQWWAYATRGAGLGARAAGLELVGLTDGRPIGWWRVFLRFLVFVGLMATGVGGIALVVFLIIHERRQGWHDMAVKSVLVQPKPVAEQKKSPGRVAKGTTSTVGLPPHLADVFSPEANSGSGSWAPPPSQQRPQQAPSYVPPPAPAKQQPPSGPPPQPPPAQFPAPQPPGGVPGHGPSLPPHRSSPTPGWIPMPTPSSVLEPSQKSVRVRQREFGEVDDTDGTTLSAPQPHDGGRPGDEGWYVRLDDSREVELSITVLLGRNPQRAPEDPEVHLVPASGDGRMISRTHVEIGTDPRGVYIVDRGSTNGTALVTDAGELEPAPSGVQMRVREGQQVSYGNRWFTVLRRPAQLS
ncbi:MAG: FHA domain-containing protein [Propionibacterium sp.]|nr:FHA domain-containing protein [Propionibacterium sp.]